MDQIEKRKKSQFETMLKISEFRTIMIFKSTHLGGKVLAESVAYFTL